MDRSGQTDARNAAAGQAPSGRLDRLAKFFSDAAMLLACLAVILMMIHVTTEAIGKYVFHVPMPATQETVQFYYMVSLVFLPIAYIARGEGHICVELFTQNLKPPARARLDVFVGILTLIWVLLIAWYAGEEAVTTTLDGELQETGNGYLIVWPGRWFIPAGCAVMGISVALQLLKDIRAAMQPRAATQSLQTASQQ